MSATELPEDPAAQDAPSFEEGNIAQAENQAEVIDDGSPRCEKCGAAIRTSDMLACQSCGWYASIGGYVEIDHGWEAQCDPDAEAPVEEEQPFKLPVWGIVLGATVLSVIAVSVAFHVVTPSVSSVRTGWSLTQLSFGFFAFAACHLVCFSKLMSAKAETNMIDIILSPQRCWIELVEHLPENQILVHGGAGGLTAVLMSLLLIGGIPYERLWDWGFEAPPEQNLMAAVMSQAQKIEGDENGLEEAVEGFAGTQNLDDLEEELPEEKPVEEPRLNIDAVVLGYRPSEDGFAKTLLIGVEHKGSLVYAGRVSPDLPDAELEDLTETLAEFKSNVPFIATDQAGVVWVVPKQLCKVSYKRQGPSGWLYEAKFEKLRGIMDLGK